MKKNCKSCGSNNLIKIKLFNKCLISNGHTHKSPLVKIFCEKCGLGFGANRYNLLSYHRSTGSSEFELARHKKIANGIYEIIIKNINKVNLILEIGAANFETSYNLFLLNKTFKIHSLEPHPENQNNFHQIYQIKKSFFDYETNLKYDVIFSNNVIEHVKDIKCFLKKTASLLNDRGIIIICCPSFLEVSTELLFADHIWHLTPWSIKNFSSQLNLNLYDHYISNWDSSTHVYLIKKHKSLIYEEHNFDKSINNKRLCFFKKWIDADLSVSRQVKKNNFVIFGAGEFTQLIKTYMPKTYNLASCILVDNDIGNRHFNKQIINIEKFKHSLKDYQVLLGIKKNDRYKVIKLLIKYGFRKENILITSI